MENLVGHKILLDLCEEFGLDPCLKGENPLKTDSFFIIDRPLVLETLFFTGENQKEVFEIKNILVNLLSQTKEFPSYNRAIEEGREEELKDILINELEKIFSQLILFYFCKELKINGYTVFNGIVYKLEYDENVVMAKARQQIEKLRKKFKLSQEQKEREKEEKRE